MNEQQAMKPYVIGLDLGGTNSVFGIVDARGDIKATTAIKTGGYSNAEDYVAACVEALQVIIEQVGGLDKIRSMGIGAPNANYYKDRNYQTNSIYFLVKITKHTLAVQFLKQWHGLQRAVQTGLQAVSLYL